MNIDSIVPSQTGKNGRAIHQIKPGYGRVATHPRGMLHQKSRNQSLHQEHCNILPFPLEGLTPAPVATLVNPRCPLRVLLVEDSLSTRNDCRRILQQHDYYDIDLLEAGNGYDGLQVALHQPLDCILLDYHLPDMSGLEFLSELHQADGKVRVPILKMTGADDVMPAVEAMKRGAQDYIIKDGNGHYLKLLPTVLKRMLDGCHASAGRHQAEAMYATLVEHITAITYMVSLEQGHHMLYVSPQIKHLGFRPESWFSHPAQRLQQIHAEDRDMVEREFRVCCQTGEAFSCEYRLQCANGDIRWFHDVASVVLDKKGKPLFIQGTMLDITDRKMMDQELENHRRFLDRLVAERTAQLECRIVLLESCNETLGNALEHLIRKYHSGSHHV